MNNTIQTIIEMDKIARQLVNNARVQAEAVKDSAEKKRIKLAEKAEAETKAETDRICGEIKKDSEEKIEKIKAEADEKCRRLDEAISKNREARINEIIERIFEGA